MKKSPLKRKTPLKAKTTLKTKTPLKAKTSLKTNTFSKQNNDEKNKDKPKVYTTLKCKQTTARKLKTPYHSIFTKDMHKCYITGATDGVDPHHIFGGSRKTLSEKYGFMLPLRHDWHTAADYSIHKDRKLCVKYRVLCENYYINELHKTREEWISEFGKWWDNIA